MNPKVSVIIPAYNTEKYIAKAIASALEQTEQNIEVIVVDDASTDSTVEIVSGFTDERLKLFVNEQNRGPSYTRNRALKQAKGEWIALLDSDDWYAPQRLEKLLPVAYEENADLIADNMYWIGDSTESPSTTTFSVLNVSLDKPRQIDIIYFIKFFLSITKPLIKRNFLLEHSLEFDETLRYEEDFLLFLMCLLNEARFIIVPELYYFYRNRKGSLMTEQLELYDQAYHTNLYLLQQEFINKNPQVKYSLSKRLVWIQKRRAYYRVVRFLKKGAFLAALAEAVRNPNFFLASWEKLPQILKYQLFHRV